MKKSVAILGTALAVSLLGSSPHADAQDAKIKEIAPADALLDVDNAGRALVSINAGVVDGKIYREVWRFNDSRLIYSKVSGEAFFSDQVFNEQSTLRRYCGGDVAQNCGVMKVDKLSRNLIVLTYRPPESSLVCAGLDYIDEDRSSAEHAQAYGNYLVSVVTCDAAGKGPEEVVARGRLYLSVIKKDGRAIANLARYKLPTQKTFPQPPSKLGNPDDAYGLAPANQVCSMATEDGGWQQQGAQQKWVAEARLRGLSPEDCARFQNAN